MGSEMRGRNDSGHSKRPVVLCCVMIVCLCLLFLYFSGSNGQAGTTAFEYGTKFSRSLGWGSEPVMMVRMALKSPFLELGMQMMSSPRAFL